MLPVTVYLPQLSLLAENLSVVQSVPFEMLIVTLYLVHQALVVESAVFSTNVPHPFEWQNTPTVKGPACRRLYVAVV